MSDLGIEWPEAESLEALGDGEAEEKEEDDEELGEEEEEEEWEEEDPEEDPPLEDVEGLAPIQPAVVAPEPSPTPSVQVEPSKGSSRSASPVAMETTPAQVEKAAVVSTPVPRGMDPPAMSPENPVPCLQLVWNPKPTPKDTCRCCWRRSFETSGSCESCRASWSCYRL